MDDRLRQFERTYQASGDRGDLIRFLAERTRAGLPPWVVTIQRKPRQKIHLVGSVKTARPYDGCVTTACNSKVWWPGLLVKGPGAAVVTCRSCLPHIASSGATEREAPHCWGVISHAHTVRRQRAFQARVKHARAMPEWTNLCTSGFYPGLDDLAKQTLNDHDPIWELDPERRRTRGWADSQIQRWEGREVCPFRTITEVIELLHNAVKCDCAGCRVVQDLAAQAAQASFAYDDNVDESPGGGSAMLNGTFEGFSEKLAARARELSP